MIFSVVKKILFLILSTQAAYANVFCTQTLANNSNDNSQIYTVEFMTKWGRKIVVIKKGTDLNSTLEKQTPGKEEDSNVDEQIYLESGVIKGLKFEESVSKTDGELTAKLFDKYGNLLADFSCK